MRRLASSFLLAVIVAAAGLRTDIEYARVGDVSLTLDARVPEGAGPFPTVIIVHGGGFIAGTKQSYVPPLFEPLTKAGFTWFTINYRLAPQYPFPAAVDDVERAIIWVKRHAAEYKADPRRIALVGESAGGHLVSYVGAEHKPEAAVAAVVSFYGPHDFEARAAQQNSLGENVKKFLNLTEMNDLAIAKMRSASPITYVARNMPPYLLIHGTADKSVPYDQSTAMCARMTRAGASCEVFTVEGAPHGIGAWEKVPEHQAYKAKMVEWLKATLR